MESGSTRGVDADQRFYCSRMVLEGVLITDDAVLELKRQAPDGCVLCELEHLDEEDWE